MEFIHKFAFLGTLNDGKMIRIGGGNTKTENNDSVTLKKN